MSLSFSLGPQIDHKQRPKTGELKKIRLCAV
jgi:hypothetical protein